MLGAILRRRGLIAGAEAQKSPTSTSTRFQMPTS